MRYLRICTVIIFVASLLFSSWVNYQYYSAQNTDYPVLTNSIDAPEISVQELPDALFQGLTATDETDGDLTEKIMVASMSHFLEPGTVNVKYVVFDSHNNAASLSRRVHFTDYQSPRFSLDKTPIYRVGSSFDLLDHLTVTDCIEGDISDRIRVISNMVHNYSEGIYPVLLEVSNSFGDTAQLSVLVHYTSKESNVSIKLHQYVVYLQQGDSFDPHQWIASVTDQNLATLDPGKIEIQGNLDVETPGTYQLVYSYANGGLTGKTAITVIVTERQA